MKGIPHQKKGRAFNYLRFAYHFGKAVPKFFGTGPKSCPVCGNRGRFLAFGQPPRFDAICPSCGGLERHRLLTLWIDRSEAELAGKRILHFAPEELIAARLKALGGTYVGTDIREGKADVVLDIQNLALEDASFDAVVCLHVLEHVDDRRALAEVFRVLTPGGIGVFMFPIVEGWAKSLEEQDLPAPIRSTADRVRYFGQYDHVRFYGRDVRDRIRDAGFALEEISAQEPEVSTHGLLRGETIFLARKPA